MSISTSTDLITPQTDCASTSSTPLVGNQLRSLADDVGTIRLREDAPFPSLEEISSDSSGGADLSRATGTTHSRTPSLSFTPPAANNPEHLRGDHAAFGAASSIDNRLDMSEIAVALEVVRNSDSSGALLHPQSSSMGGSPSQRRDSRRRSTSRTKWPPHNVEDEELPNERFHDPAFQQAFLRAKQVMSEFTDVLSSGAIHNDPDSSMKRLHQKARNLSLFNCPSTRRVGFVGDSGVGKSSLLNSLLDYRGLARTSSSGHACTCVVTEYHYHSTNDFAIEVQWFSMDEIAARLTELLHSYRSYHFDPEGSSELKDQAVVAQQTFQAMFRRRFENELFLTQSADDTVMETLRSWAREVVPSSNDRREVHATLEDCGNCLQQLTSEQELTQEPAKWPYISKVKVFSNAYILRNGLVLVDLPGLRDLNGARQTITERYLRDECNGIFAVCSISRATTDASVMSVFELAERAKLSNVGIVCTMSDAIKAEESRRDWPEERANKIQLLLEAIVTDQRDFELAEADLASYDEVENDELSEAEVVDLTELRKTSLQAKKRKNQHQFELKRYLINTRNAEVRHKLTDMYQDTIPGNSNDDYWNHRDSAKDQALPFLQLSGIFEIRKHCISMVAKSQLSIAREYITADIRALLGEVELWVQSGAGSMDAERKQRISETLNKVEARLKQDNAQTIGVKLPKMPVLYGPKHILPTVAYKYFCQHFGKHDTDTVGEHNWNEEAINEMVMDLTAPWRNLESTLQSILERDIELVLVIMDRAIEYIDIELRESPGPAGALCRTMRSRQRLLITDLERTCFEKFQARLSTLTTDAFSGLRTSFIGQLMEESYNECNAKKGPGSHRMRSEIITNRLGNEMVFVSLQARFRNQFRALTESLQNDVQAAVATHLLFIKNTLDIIRNENVALESERDPEFRRKVEREVRTVIHEIRHLQDIMTL